MMCDLQVQDPDGWHQVPVNFTQESLFFPRMLLKDRTIIRFSAIEFDVLNGRHIGIGLSFGFVKLVAGHIVFLSVGLHLFWRLFIDEVMKCGRSILCKCALLATWQACRLPPMQRHNLAMAGTCFQRWIHYEPHDVPRVVTCLPQAGISSCGEP